MHTREELSEDVPKKMLQELYKLLAYYRWLIFSGSVVGGGLCLQALLFAGSEWLRVGIGWFGLSLLAASGWIYIYAYKGARRETAFFERLLDIRRQKISNSPHKYYRYIGRLAGNLYFLFFINGLLISLLIAVSLEDKYENSFFKALSRKVLDTHANNEDALLMNAVDICHNVLRSRSAVFGDEMEPSLIDRYIHPLSTDLITANGSCGSYSFVLGRLLQVMGYPVRLVQMKVGQRYGGHIVLEARSSHGWVALDALYDLYFIKPDGHLASFDDVARDWHYYSLQTPKDYDPQYRYEGVRYTNWDKIPFILPSLRTFLGLLMDRKHLDHFSLRTYFLRKYLFLKYILFILVLLVSSAIIFKIAPGRKTIFRPFPLYNYC